MLTMKNSLQAIASIAIAVGLMACGGGGGGHYGGGGGSSGGGTVGGGTGGGSGDVLYYPYENGYGDICSTMESSPGCTFDRATGTRINVTYDPHYDRFLGGSDDLL